jgi:hypothetical protein
MQCDIFMCLYACVNMYDNGGWKRAGREGSREIVYTHTNMHYWITSRRGLTNCAVQMAAPILGTLLRSSRAKMSGSCSNRMDGLEQSCS